MKLTFLLSILLVARVHLDSYFGLIKHLKFCFCFFCSSNINKRDFFRLSFHIHFCFTFPKSQRMLIFSPIENKLHGKKAADTVIFPDKENGLRTNLVTLASIEPTKFTLKADALNWFPKYNGSWMDNVGFGSVQEKLPRMRLFCDVIRILVGRDGLVSENVAIATNGYCTRFWPFMRGATL